MTAKINFEFVDNETDMHLPIGFDGVCVPRAGERIILYVAAGVDGRLETEKWELDVVSVTHQLSTRFYPSRGSVDLHGVLLRVLVRGLAPIGGAARQEPD